VGPFSVSGQGEDQAARGLLIENVLIAAQYQDAAPLGGKALSFG